MLRVHMIVAPCTPKAVEYVTNIWGPLSVWPLQDSTGLVEAYATQWVKDPVANNDGSSAHLDTLPTNMAVLPYDNGLD